MITNTSFKDNDLYYRYSYTYKNGFKYVENLVGENIEKAIKEIFLWKHVFKNLLNIDTSFRTIINSGNRFKTHAALLKI